MVLEKDDALRYIIAMNWGKPSRNIDTEKCDRTLVIGYLEHRDRWPIIVGSLRVQAFNQGPKTYALPLTDYCRSAGLTETSKELAESVFKNFRTDFSEFAKALDAANADLLRTRGTLEKAVKALDSYIQRFPAPISISELRRLHPRDFERFIGKYFERSGYSVCVVGRSNDGGVDVIAVKATDRLVIQCKRNKDGNNVGAKVVQSIAGNTAKKAFFGYRGLVVTTSSFTSEAYRQANDYRDDLIELWDHRTLMHHLTEQAKGNSPLIKAARDLKAQVQAFIANLPGFTLDAMQARALGLTEGVDKVCASSLASEIPNLRATLLSIPPPSPKAPIPIRRKGVIVSRLAAMAASLAIAVGVPGITYSTTWVWTHFTNARASNGAGNVQASNWRGRALSSRHARERLLSRRRDARLATLERLVRALPPNEFHAELPKLYADLESGRLCQEPGEFGRVAKYIKSNRVVTSRQVAKYWDEILATHERCKAAT